MEWKQEAIKEGNICPSCGETDTIESESHPEVVDNIVTLEMCCCECDAEWIEIYKMADIKGRQ